MRFELHLTGFQTAGHTGISLTVYEASRIPQQPGRPLIHWLTSTPTAEGEDPEEWARDTLVHSLELLGTLNPTGDEPVGELGGCA